jgi:hypothetical protein
MDSTRVTRQTSTTLPLRGELTHDAPAPKALWHGAFTGPLQWTLEGPGWGIVRPVVDFVLLCVAVVAALGGVEATLHVSSMRAPLLALPLLVMALFYLRGLYRTRLRALVLDGMVPVLSGVSVAAMAVATLGILVNGQLPNQSDWLRGWLFALIGVGAGRVILSFAQRVARTRHRVGKSVLIMAHRSRADWSPIPSTGSSRSASSTRIHARWPRSADATSLCWARSTISTRPCGAPVSRT